MEVTYLDLKPTQMLNVASPLENSLASSRGSSEDMFLCQTDSQMMLNNQKSVGDEYSGKKDKRMILLCTSGSKQEILVKKSARALHEIRYN